MSYLQNVTSGIEQTGQRIVICGREKIGKTTLACQAPGSLLVPLEAGYNAIASPRLKNTLNSWREVKAFIQEIMTASQQGRGLKRGQSLVFDSATALERLIHDETLSVDTPGNKATLGKAHSMESSHGGYGKAYPIANALFGEFLGWMDQLAFYGGINVILTCHIAVMRVIDPTAGEYDTFEILLHSPKNNKNYGKREHLTQWADGIFLLRETMLVSKEKDSKVSLGVDLNSGRILEVDRAPAWTAGNRYGMTEALKIPKEQGWNYLADAIFRASGNTIDVFNRAIMPTQ